MGTQENDKKVLIYFYYLAITRQKEASATSTYDIAQITNAFSKNAGIYFEHVSQIVPLSESPLRNIFRYLLYPSLSHASLRLGFTFKSAKYNHVRNEINTETMEPLGTRKQRRDGDEEKTHLCIRLAQGHG